MLPDHYSQLLTAFVDGDLTGRQRQAVLKVLERSSEARQILKELQEQSNRLRQLPEKKLEANFAESVLKEIQIRGLLPTSPPLVPLATRKIPAWTKLATAAAVMLMVAFGSYLYFTSAPENPPLEGPRVEEKTNPDPLVTQLIDGTFKDYALPGFRVGTEDLAKDKTKNRLIQEFRNESSVHLQLATPDHGKAAERLVDSFAKRDIKLFIDEPVRAGMKNADPRTEYLVYAENMEAQELATILGELGSTPERAESLVVSGLTGEQRGQVARLLGVDQDKLKAPPSKLELFHPIPATDPKGKKEDKGKKEANPKLLQPLFGEPMAVVLALDPQASPQARSAQIKQFVQSRRAQRPGSVQVVMLLQSV